MADPVAKVVARFVGGRLRRRHRKAHRILSLVLFLTSLAVMTVALGQWLNAPVPEPLDPRLGPAEGENAP